MKVVSLCQAGVPTRHKRLYSKEILTNEIARLQEDIKNRAFLGSLNPDYNSNGIIRLAEVSHYVESLWLGEQEYLMAKIVPLDTPNGKILKHLLDEGIDVNFAMSGFGGGRVDDNGVLILGNNYKLNQIGAFAKL